MESGLIESELMELKAKIEQMEKRLNESRGVERALLDQLKTLNISSFKEAETILWELEKTIKKEEKKLQEELEELMDKFYEN